MEIKHPYLLFLGDAPDQLAAKTANGVAQWRPEWCLGQFRMPGCAADLGLPDMGIEAAAAAGAQTLVIGVANRGGKISAEWQDHILTALDLGMDIASGLHNRLTDIPAVVARAEQRGRQLFDVRHPTEEFDVGTGLKRQGKRLLTVGTDASVGKMFTSLALEREMERRGLNATFRATGQTGIFISGRGVSVDAVIADFISGAVEWLAPEHDDPDHWDLIEGQGSLFHASFAGVSLGLLHGAQPDAMILCHEPGRRHMRGLPHYPLPSVAECIAMNEQCARLTNPAARVVGISCNTSNLDDGAATDTLARLADAHGMPAVDPVRGTVEPLADAIAAL